MTDDTLKRTAEGAPRLETLRRELRDFLLVAKRSIDDEILSYPKPIPRCDAQFNFLYEQRSRVSQVLARTLAPPARGDELTALTDTLAEFSASPPVTGDASERALRERIETELARLILARADRVIQ